MKRYTTTPWSMSKILAWKIGPAALFALGVGAFLALSLHYSGVIGENMVDDAFIYFRYADNLACGQGLVYNPGEPVEGYASVLWVMMLALALAVDIPPILAAEILGILFGVLTLFAAWRLAVQLLGLRRWLALVPVFLQAFNRSFAVWSIEGLETPLFSFLVTAAAWSWASEMQSGAETKKRLLCGALFGLLPLGRPEGYFFLTVFLIITFVSAARSRLWLRFLERAGVAVAIAFTHVLMRVIYYGDILPNAFYAKVVGLGVEQGTTYISELILRNGVALYGCLALLGAARLVAWRHTRGFGLWASLCTLGIVLYLVSIGGDYFEFRFLNLILPFLGILTAAGIALVTSQMRKPAIKAVVTGALSLISIASTASPFLETSTARKGTWSTPEREVQFTKRFIQAGRWLGQNIGADESIAIRPAGAIAYLTRARALDLLGLNDRKIAKDTANVVLNGVAGHQRRVTPNAAKRRGYTYYIGHPRFSKWPCQIGQCASVEMENGEYFNFLVLDPRAKFQHRVYSRDEHRGYLPKLAPRARAQ